MDELNPVTAAIQMLHRDRALWQFRAQLDPVALPEMIAMVVAQTGLPPEMAQRVIESELDLRRSTPSDARSRRPTRRDGMPVAQPASSSSRTGTR